MKSEDFNVRYELSELFNKREPIYDERKLLNNIRKMISEHHPSMLYRYRSCNKYSIRGFRKNSVVGVKPSKFNDPYDCLLRYEYPNSKGLSSDEYRKIVDYFNQNHSLPPALEEFMPDDWVDDFVCMIKNYIAGNWQWKDDSSPSQDVNKIINDKLLRPFANVLLEFSRVACFSESPDSMLMWSHYASQHTGFVLGYDLADTNNKSCLDFLYPVIYSDSRYDATDAFRYEIGRCLNMKKNVNLDPLFYIPASIYKSKCWEYEKEWRLVSFGNDEDLVEIIMKPSCIYYGSRIDEDDREKLHYIAKSKGMKECEAYIDPSSSRYSLSFRECL